MYITLTEADILTGQNGPSIAAARTAALKAGQSDPLPEVIDQVTTLVRGRVAACARNTLGEAGTIPDECKAEAIDIAVYRLCKRLGSALVTPLIEKANDNANAFLRDVAACEVAIVAPETPTTEAISAPSPSITSRTRNFDRCSQDGI